MIKKALAVFIATLPFFAFIILMVVMAQREQAAQQSCPIHVTQSV